MQGLRVWTWDDLWAEVRAHETGDGPAVLSEVASREFLRTAVAQARKAGELDGLGPLAETAGYRHYLQGQFSEWSRQHRRPGSEAPPGADVATWAVYGRYRRLLESRRVADRPLFESWAAGRVGKVWASLAGSAPVFVIDPPSAALERQALKAIIQRAPSVHMLLHWEEDPDRQEVYLDLQRMRDGCRAFGFETVEHEVLSDRPEGLRSLHQTLFREPEPAPVEEAEGLFLLGAPQGDGSALRIVRAVRDRLDSGEPPDGILVLFPRWSELSDRTFEVLREAGIPAWSSRRRPLANDPALSALHLVLDVASDGWESASIASLLRLGPVALEGFERADLASAASSVRSLKVFRGLDAILNRLRSETNLDPREEDPRKKMKAQRAETASRVLEALGQIYSGLGPADSWAERCRQLERLLEKLSLSGPVTGLLLSALEEQGEARSWTGRADSKWGWNAFSREVQALAREVVVDPPSEPPGTVRLALVSEAVGASARHVVLAGLDEGAFPDAGALDLETTGRGPEEAGPTASECAYAREMRRFLSVVDIPSRSLTLVYPTTDEKGVSLLPAGFLDDVRGRFSESVLDSWHKDEMKRLDPVVPEALALSPAEQRVRAVGRACLENPEEALHSLRKLAVRPEHGEALKGTARALRVAAERRRRSKFGPFEGDLHASSARPPIALDFGPARKAPFSPSHLETLANCPFQFFLRHVLRIEPAEEPEELDEDYTSRGQLIHASLQEMHDVLRLSDQSEASLSKLVAEVVEVYIERELNRLLPPGSDVDEGLRLIESKRLYRTGKRYARQFEEYQEKLAAECRRCEVGFGKPDSPFPALRLGDGDDSFGLQGVIDRIDTVAVHDAVLFRIIDYKTGSCPQKSDLKAGLALQLPLYALAAERIILAEERAEPFDVGYWALRDKGFRAVGQRIKVKKGTPFQDEDWPEDLKAVEAFVVELVRRLRAAEFPVAPRSDDCTRTCEYKNICRIGQVRALDKSWADAPSMRRPS